MRVAVTLIVALIAMVMLALNGRVDGLWSNYPDQSGPCSARQEAGCRYDFVN